MRSRSSRGLLRSLPRAKARAAAAIALGAIAFGCGADESPPASAPTAEPTQEQSAQEQAAPPAPAAESPAAGAPAPDAGTAATDGVIPQDFPSDIPVYPGAQPGPAMNMPGLGVFVTFETDDTVEAILAHYRTELANNGWTVQDTSDGDGVDGTKEGRSVQVRARPNESGRSEIAVSIGKS